MGMKRRGGLYKAIVPGLKRGGVQLKKCEWTETGCKKEGREGQQRARVGPTGLCKKETRLGGSQWGHGQTGGF